MLRAIYIIHSSCRRVRCTKEQAERKTYLVYSSVQDSFALFKCCNKDGGAGN